MLDPKRSTLYRDHLLSHMPTRTEDGYQARVAISYLGGDKTHAQRFLDLEVFATEEQAIDHARQAGMKWVDANWHLPTPASST